METQSGLLMCPRSQRQLSGKGQIRIQVYFTPQFLFFPP